MSNSKLNYTPHEVDPPPYEVLSGHYLTHVQRAGFSRKQVKRFEKANKRKLAKDLLGPAPKKTKDLEILDDAAKADIQHSVNIRRTLDPEFDAFMQAADETPTGVSEDELDHIRMGSDGH